MAQTLFDQLEFSLISNTDSMLVLLLCLARWGATNNLASSWCLSCSAVGRSPPCSSCLCVALLDQRRRTLAAVVIAERLLPPLAVVLVAAAAVYLMMNMSRNQFPMTVLTPPTRTTTITKWTKRTTVRTIAKETYAWQSTKILLLKKEMKYSYYLQ